MITRERLKKLALKILQFIFNPHLLICVGIAWFITNGWSYIALGLGTYFKIPWLIAVAGAYLTFLWIPFTPEKIITVIIAIWLLKVLFPDDRKTLAVLKNAKEKYKLKKENKK